MKNLDYFIQDKKILKNFKEPIRVLGIDLGTTNSAVAEIIFDPAKDIEIKANCLPVIQPTESGDTTQKTIPSVVAIKDNRIYIGEGAQRMIPKIASRQFTKNTDIFYECKNEIGTKRIYNKAPEGFKTPAEISGKILEFIYNSVKVYSELPIQKTIVTVPASFGPSQRMDTVTAAGLGGIFTIDKGDLLDEPLAAFIHYIMNEGLELIKKIDRKKNFLIFDFGGGTCDVSIIELDKYIVGESLKMKYKSVSRYHRLGGGDIDKAIIYDILIPQILEQNNLLKSEFGYEIKKLFLEPGLSGIAESLKIGISTEISRLKKFDKYDIENRDKIIKNIPSSYRFEIHNKKFVFNTPQINALQFENILDDFLNSDFLYARETEYKLLNSIFAPLQDSLDRCNLEKEDVDFVLMTGGSSYISKIKEEINEFFENAEILDFDNEEEYQTSIASGAAYQSMFKILNGKGIVEQVNHYSISINTSKGLVELIPAGVNLPYPAENEIERNFDLRIPESSNDDSLYLSLEIVDTDTQTLITKRIWEIENEVYQGQKIILEYRMNNNGIIEMWFRLLDDKNEKFEMTVENPLLNTVKPDTSRIQIEEIEHIIKTERLSEEYKLEKFKQLASLYYKIGYNEKAIEFYKKIINKQAGEDANSFNTLATLYEKEKDFDKMKETYREGFRKFRWGGFMFNLALKEKNAKEYENALRSINEAISIEDALPYFVLEAMIQEKLNNEVAKQEALNNVKELIKEIDLMDDWELGWYATYCEMINDTENKKSAEKEIRKRAGDDKIISLNNSKEILPDKGE